MKLFKVWGYILGYLTRIIPWHLLCCFRSSPGEDSLHIKLRLPAHYYKITALLRRTLYSSYDLSSKRITSKHSIHIPGTGSIVSFQNPCDDARVSNTHLVGHGSQLLDDPWFDLCCTASI